MERERNDVSLIPAFFKQPWDVVKLGRRAGVFVLLSAVGLAIWEVVGLRPIPTEDFQLLIRLAWRTLVSVGSWGVIILLLAELVGRLYGGEDNNDRDEEVVEKC